MAVEGGREMRRRRGATTASVKPSSTLLGEDVVDVVLWNRPVRLFLLPPSLAQPCLTILLVAEPTCLPHERLIRADLRSISSVPCYSSNVGTLVDEWSTGARSLGCRSASGRCDGWCGGATT